MQQRERKNRLIEEFSETIQTTPEVQRLPFLFSSIDHENTKLHDDAIAINKIDKEWYEVWCAISGISNRTNINTKKLPWKMNLSIPGRKVHYSLSQEKFREAFIFTYVTNGEEIHQPYMSQAIIQAKETTEHTLDARLKRDMLHITKESHVHSAIAKFNTTTNYALGRLALQKEIPFIFDNHIDHVTTYSNEPLGHEGLQIDAYVRATSPLRDTKDRIVLGQAYQAIKKNGNVLNKQNIAHICEYYNRGRNQAA